MRTRNADKPKPAPPAKSTPPARKSAAKNPRKSAELSPQPSSATPKSSGTRRAPSTRGKQVKSNDTEASPIISDNNTPQSAVAEDNDSSVAVVVVTPETKRGPVKKVTRGKQAKISETKLINEAETSSVPDTSMPESAGKLINETEASPVPDTSTPEPSGKSINETKASPVPDNMPGQAGKLIEETEAIPIPDSTTEQAGKMTKGTEAIHVPDTMGEPSEAKASADAVVEVAPEKKRVIVKKVTRVVKQKVVRKKTATSSKDASSDTPKSQDVGIERVGESPLQTPTQDSGAEKVEESLKEAEDAVSEGYAKNSDVFPSNMEVRENKEELPALNIEESILEDRIAPIDDEPVQMELISDLHSCGVDAVTSTKHEYSTITDTVMSLNLEDQVVKDVNPLEIQESIDAIMEDKAEEVLEKIENGEGKIKNSNEFVKIEQKISGELDGDELREEKVIEHEDEKNEEHAGLYNILKDYGKNEIGEENVGEHGEEAQREQEQEELTALATERKMKKEMEVFVGGLDSGASEEDVKKVFQHIGEVVEVHVHNDSSNGKNKGYAFVKFATKEQATRALTEVKNPVINGKRCGMAPCEDNDTLFLGNICNTWTEEAIRKKLKDYEVDGVKNITLVSDPQREGLSRGFAFIQFSCHGDAMLAYKRLQKPDVVFGHLERTAKVAFAEPLREPDPEVMMHVKSVFVDGLPPQWNEDHVRDLFKGYGEIERIMLARNMSTSKRKDFGFVDFTTHEAAIACIDDINSKELGNGNSKVKVRARLSNPLPKTQAVKGEMSGGFQIGSSSSGSLARIGRASGRSFQKKRGLYHHGRGQAGRMSFSYDYSTEESFRGRQSFGQGGRWGSFRGAHQVSSGGNMPARYNGDRPRPDAFYSGPERHMHFRGQPFPPQEFNRTFTRHYDDPYPYSDRAHGIKRPFIPDQDPNYMEPSRVRPRLDYYGPAAPIPRTQYRDTFGAGSSVQSHDYYGSDYVGGGGGSHSSFYRGERPYRGGYY